MPRQKAGGVTRTLFPVRAQDGTGAPAVAALVSEHQIRDIGRWEPIVTGIFAAPTVELIFADGDVVMAGGEPVTTGVVGLPSEDFLFAEADVVMAWRPGA